MFFSAGKNADGSGDCLHTLLFSSQYCLGESLLNVFEFLNKTFFIFPQLILEASGFLTASSEAGYR